MWEFSHCPAQPEGRSCDEGQKMSTGCKGPLGSAGCEVSPHAAGCVFQVLKLRLSTCCLKTQELVLQVHLVRMFIGGLQGN